MWFFPVAVLLGVAQSLPVNLTDATSNLIDWGARAGEHQFPFMGFFENGEDYLNGCGAVLISRYHAITHNTCRSLIAIGGKISFDFIKKEQGYPAQEATVKEINQLTRYGRSPLAGPYDLLLFTFEEPGLPDILPVPIARNSYYHPYGEYSPLSIGYGYAYANPNPGPVNYPPGTLNYAVAKYLDDRICKRQWHDYNYTAMCAGLKYGGDLLHRGDTGGSLVDSKDGKYLLRGIAAYTPQSHSGFYVRVSEFCDLFEEYTRGAMTCRED
ncbi:hypothetical protein QR680_014998 [Steinernema hermaphroditum]|uniref:Peptidase S1 domain-containing protein n=1 Tax=Steinernema hermaphroditum TaxID=289476 RepID=A0AA39ICC7_9BILA|nr:hypothetical protein QR680_014998 [Steinernema hermaphroditum]